MVMKKERIQMIVDVDIRYDTADDKYRKYALNSAKELFVDICGGGYSAHSIKAKLLQDK